MTYNISRNARIKLPEVWITDRLVECDFSLQELIDDYINNTDTNNTFYDNLLNTRYFRHLTSFSVCLLFTRKMVSLLNNS